jgi:hypothetical protein
MAPASEFSLPPFPPILPSAKTPGISTYITSLLLFLLPWCVGIIRMPILSWVHPNPTKDP